MKTCVSILLSVLMVGLTVGCTPMYAGKPTEAKNSITASRDAWGGMTLGATGAADTTVDVDGFKYKGKDGQSLDVDKVRFAQNPSQTIASWSGPMEVYDKQLKTYYEGLTNVATANWAGFTNAISAAAPIAAPYLQGLAQAKLAKAQRPGLVGQLSDLVVAGKVSTQSMQEIDVPPDILAEVDRLVKIRVDAKIAELKAQQATTQPTTP